MTSNHMLMIILTDDVKSAHLYKVDFFSDKNFKICVYFFSCILPDYMADDIIKDFWKNNHFENMARTYLQLPLRQWGAGNVYLLVLSSWKVNIAENPIAVMGL